VTITLVPQGAALSRRVTFLDMTHSAREAAAVPGAANTALGF
jgi:hypothetical protein